MKKEGIHVLAEELWERYLNTKEEKWKQDLILNYLPLVKEIARRLSMGLPRHIDSDDLVSWGVLGLLDAISKFKPEMGSKFKSYASLRIKGAILDELRRFSWAPRSLMQNIKKVNEAYRILENKLGREVTTQEVAEFLKVSPAFVEKVMAQVNHCSVVSLDTVLFNGDDSQSKPLIESISSRDDCPENKLEKKEKIHFLKIALDKLNERERLLLSLYYYEELTMKEIGEILNLSESRVSQIHSRTLLKLRRYLKED